jgi:8-oxo-dGTP pyrophosphatase MutT (NUDIX family)
MVKRHERSAFGSAYAFPGGVLEKSDHEVHDQCVGLSDEDADRALGLEGIGLDYFSAAIRELFEESGVLLGETTLSGSELDSARVRLNEGLLRWDRFVIENKIRLRCDRLHYFSFWITPKGLPKRYSTRFFLAELPKGQSAAHCGGELTDSCWMPASGVLEARKDKTMRVPYPTRKTLKSIARFDTTASLCGWARQCAERGVICDQPAFAPELFE